MNKRNIRRIIGEKIGDWIESIEDPELKKLVAGNTIVTGGCIASMLLNENVNDYDVYFRTREVTLAVARYYLDRFKPKAWAGIECPMYVDDTRPDRISIVVKSVGIASEDGAQRPYQYFESQPDDAAASYVGEVVDGAGAVEDKYESEEAKALEREATGKDKPYRPVFISTNAVTLSDRVQLVLRFYGEPDQIHENYDFVHCTNYWTSWDKELVLRQDALESLMAKELRYVGSRYPICSIMRVRKFIKRGWYINAGQLLKAVVQASQLDLTDINVLRDQLTGVDSAYFAQVLDRLQDKCPDKVDCAYLVEIIDRMF